MYNTDLPTRAELPSAMKLMQSTILAAIVALTLLITIVMPSEYGIDPTGVAVCWALNRWAKSKRSWRRKPPRTNRRVRASGDSQPLR